MCGENGSIRDERTGHAFHARPVKEVEIAEKVVLPSPSAAVNFDFRNRFLLCNGKHSFERDFPVRFVLLFGKNFFRGRDGHFPARNRNRRGFRRFSPFLSPNRTRRPRNIPVRRGRLSPRGRVPRSTE